MVSQVDSRIVSKSQPSAIPNNLPGLPLCNKAFTLDFFMWADLPWAPLCNYFGRLRPQQKAVNDENDKLNDFSWKNVRLNLWITLCGKEGCCWSVTYTRGTDVAGWIFLHAYKQWVLALCLDFTGLSQCVIQQSVSLQNLKSLQEEKTRQTEGLQDCRLLICDGLKRLPWENWLPVH